MQFRSSMQFDVICCWILLAFFMGVFSDIKMVEKGGSVDLYTNVTADNAEEVNIYGNGAANYILIVTRKFVNGSFELEWKTLNFRKINMDDKGNIRINDVDETYEMKFYIHYSTKISEVEVVILKTNSTTNITALNENTQKDDALPETSSPTERTPQKKTTQKGDAIPETSYSPIEKTPQKETDMSSIVGYLKAIMSLLVFCILVVVIKVVIWKKDCIFACIQCKKSNGASQLSIEITSPCESDNSTSYKLIWNKPADEYRLQRYNLRYREVQSLEQPSLLGPFLSLDGIPASTVSYSLSPLKPGRFYEVEIQAINEQGHPCSKNFKFRTKASVPQPVQVTSRHDSLDSTSYQLMWDEPDDGGSRLIKYIIRYCEVEIIPDITEYEQSRNLTPFKYVDNILPSLVSYKLSPLIPGRYYLVEIQAINTQGQSLNSFIFKTKEGVPQQVQVTCHRAPEQAVEEVTVSVPGPSGTQPINNKEQDAILEQDKAPDEKVDSDSDEDKCQDPLLAVMDHIKMKKL